MQRTPRAAPSFSYSNKISIQHEPRIPILTRSPLLIRGVARGQGFVHDRLGIHGSVGVQGGRVEYVLEALYPSDGAGDVACKLVAQEQVTPAGS